MLPPLHPTTTSTGTPSRSSTWSTPTDAAHCAAPDPMTTPTRGRERTVGCSLARGGGQTRTGKARDPALSIAPLESVGEVEDEVEVRDPEVETGRGQPAGASGPQEADGDRDGEGEDCDHGVYQVVDVSTDDVRAHRRSRAPDFSLQPAETPAGRASEEADGPVCTGRPARSARSARSDSGVHPEPM